MIEIKINLGLFANVIKPWEFTKQVIEIDNIKYIIKKSKVKYNQLILKCEKLYPL